MLHLCLNALYVALQLSCAFHGIFASMHYVWPSSLAVPSMAEVQPWKCGILPLPRCVVGIHDELPFPILHPGTSPHSFGDSCGARIFLLQGSPPN